MVIPAETQFGGKIRTVNSLTCGEKHLSMLNLRGGPYSDGKRMYIVFHRTLACGVPNERSVCL